MKQTPENREQNPGNHSAGANVTGTPNINTDSSEKWQQERRNGCSICGRKGCCADDHVLHGPLVGMGF